MVSPTQGFGLGLEGVGLGLEIYGGLEAAGFAKQKAQAEQQQFRLDMQLNQVRRQAMETQNRRAQLQQVRQAQVARSMALTSASGQGAQFSSSLQGGYAGIAGSAGSNIAGLSTSLQSGEQAFNITEQIDEAKIAESEAARKQAGAQGLAAIGTGLMGLGGSKFFG